MRTACEAWRVPAGEVSHSDLNLNPKFTECPLRVISGRFSCLPKRSAFGGKADIFQGVAECPLIANSGHSALPLLLFIDHSFDRMRSGK